jgi:hypothetical protein
LIKNPEILCRTKIGPKTSKNENFTPNCLVFRSGQNIKGNPQENFSFFQAWGTCPRCLLGYGPDLICHHRGNKIRKIELLKNFLMEIGKKALPEALIFWYQSKSCSSQMKWNEKR